MKEIINFLINNDLIGGEKMNFDKRVLITNTKLRTLMCKELVKRTENADIIILEEGNDESIIWGTLISLMIKKPSLYKVDSVYRKVNVPEIHKHLTSVTNGFPKSFEMATGYSPAKNGLDVIFAIIAAEIFEKKFCRTPAFGVVQMATKTKGRSTFNWKEGRLVDWEMNISQFIEPRPEWPERDKRVLLGVNLTKDFVDRIKSNMLVIKPVYVTGDDPSAVLPRGELEKIYNDLENPIAYAD